MKDATSSAENIPLANLLDKVEEINDSMGEMETSFTVPQTILDPELTDFINGLKNPVPELKGLDEKL